MSIEKSRPRLNKNDILKAFGDRVLAEQKEKVEREYLDLDTDISVQDIISTDFIQQYENISIDDCIPAHVEYPDGPRYKPISVTLLKGGPKPISLVVTKSMWSEEGAEHPDSAIIIQIVKGDLTGKSDKEVEDILWERSGAIGNFRLHKADGGFEMPHRFVREDYRGPQDKKGTRISNILLNICEQIVKSSATSKQKSELLTVDSGQLDVMLWLHNNGYKLRGYEDEDRFEKICSADESLRITDDLFIFEHDKVLEPDKIHEKRQDSYRIAFKKDFPPEVVGQRKESLLQGVRNLISST